MSRRGALLFALMSVIWGLPYLFIKISVRQVDPATLVFVRTAMASVLLVPLAARRGAIRPVLVHWKWLLAYAAVEVAVPWLLISDAETRLSSSLSGLLVAAVPLVGVGVAAFDPGRDRLGRRGTLGLLVGLAGVATLLGFDVGRGDAVAVASIGVVVVGYALGPAIVARRLRDTSGLGVAAVSLLACALAYAPWGVTHLPAHPRAETLWSLLVLGVVCTAVAFVAFFALITEIGPVRATVVTYLNPAVALVLGVAFLHERFSPATGLGFLLILAGSYLSTRRPRNRAPAGAVTGTGSVATAGSVPRRSPPPAPG